METTREEHMTWCKKRAHEYLDTGDAKNAVTSMMSDLNKHEGTRSVAEATAMLGMMAAMEGTVEAARRFVDGFN